MLIARGGRVGIDLLPVVDRLDDPVFVAIAETAIDAGWELLREENKAQQQ